MYPDAKSLNYETGAKNFKTKQKAMCLFDKTKTN